MDVTLHYSDGSESETFDAESFKTINDVAFVDGILHTNVEGVTVTG